MTQSADLATVAEDLALAAVADDVGTRAMEAVSTRLYELQDEQPRRQDDEARQGPPYEIAAKKIRRVLGLRLDGTALHRASMAMHDGLAVGRAPVYSLLRRRGGLSPRGAALAGGASMSLLVDEELTPRLGFQCAQQGVPACHAPAGVRRAPHRRAGGRLRGRLRPPEAPAVRAAQPAGSSQRRRARARGGVPATLH